MFINDISVISLHHLLLSHSKVMDILIILHESNIKSEESPDIWHLKEKTLNFHPWEAVNLAKYPRPAYNENFEGQTKCRRSITVHD